jgi:hypothetical protein
MAYHASKGPADPVTVHPIALGPHLRSRRRWPVPSDLACSDPPSSRGTVDPGFKALKFELSSGRTSDALPGSITTTILPWRGFQGPSS